MIEDHPLRQALQRRSIFVTGKGGVGKTITAAALAELRIARGERVLLVEIDHASPSLSRIYDTPSGPEPIRIKKGLYLCNLRWRASLEAYLNESLPGKRAAQVLMNFRVTRAFLEALPMARESVLLRALVRLHREGRDRFDCIIVDLPASGHAIALFSTARTIQRVFRAGTPVRRQAEEIEEFFGGNYAGLVLTAIPEEMSVTETIETAAKFDDLSYPQLLGVLLNRYPGQAPQAELRPALEELRATLGGEGSASEAVSSAITELKQRERADVALERLRSSLGQVFPIPLLPLAGMDLVRALATSLEDL